jgi:hypothetical protein
VWNVLKSWKKSPDRAVIAGVSSAAGSRANTRIAVIHWLDRECDLP